ncbi:MAG: L,D-transpeptidase [Pseudolabrys sp.]|nr:L,D-transpeptidase [Pseudolabrys sp.]
MALVSAQPARADLAIHVDKSLQQMTVALNGEPLFVWPVSTGAAGHDTPSGTFTPFRLEKDHFSKEWDDAPMPHSVFFTRNGHAIHGSTHLKALGTPASHGCVRLEPKNAAVLFDLVKQEGLNKVRVSITGTIPSRQAPAVARREAPAQNSFSRVFNNDRFFGDDDVVGSVPPPVRVQRGERLVREYRDGRTYYYRVEPRRYGYGYDDRPSYGLFGR